MRVKTTKRHFKVFCDECRRWIGIYGLVGYEVVFHHGDCSDGAGGETEAHNGNKWAIISLADEWEDIRELDDEMLRRVAFHEVTELLLMQLRSLAEYRFLRAGEVDAAIHTVIRTLENVLYERYKGK